MFKMPLKSPPITYFCLKTSNDLLLDLIVADIMVKYYHSHVVFIERKVIISVTDEYMTI